MHLALPPAVELCVIAAHARLRSQQDDVQNDIRTALVKLHSLASSIVTPYGMFPNQAPAILDACRAEATQLGILPFTAPDHVALLQDAARAFLAGALRDSAGPRAVQVAILGRWVADARVWCAMAASTLYADGTRNNSTSYAMPGLQAILDELSAYESPRAGCWLTLTLDPSDRAAQSPYDAVAAAPIKVTAYTLGIVQRAQDAGMRPAWGKPYAGTVSLSLGTGHPQATFGTIRIGAKSGKVLRAEFIHGSNGPKEQFTGTVAVRTALLRIAARLDDEGVYRP